MRKKAARKTTAEDIARGKTRSLEPRYRFGGDALKITFTDRERITIADTMAFEACFEPELRLTFDEKADILDVGEGAWMFVDGTLAGETYGATPAAIYERTGEEIEDCHNDDECSFYVYSTSFLPQYRGLGLAPVFMAHFQGFLTGKLRPRWVHDKLIGHATTPHMISLREMFGATFGATHANWCGSPRTAVFYEQPL
jgi:hypothetical protein